MIICLNLMYYFYSSRVTPNFSRGKKLLHVFWNTLYMYMNTVKELIILIIELCNWIRELPIWISEFLFQLQSSLQCASITKLSTMHFNYRVVGSLF